MKTSLSLIFLIVATILFIVSAFVVDANARIFRIGMAFFAASFVAW